MSLLKNWKVIALTAAAALGVLLPVSLASASHITYHRHCLNTGYGYYCWYHPHYNTSTSTQAAAPSTFATQTTAQTVAGLTAQEQQMLNLVNGARTRAGLPALKADLELTKVARIKSQDMIANSYFSHQSPTYGSPFTMLRTFGVSYRTAGENIAGNGTVQGAHTALMNSSGHRANILSSQYTSVGIGIVQGGRYGMMFTQLFKS